MELSDLASIAEIIGLVALVPSLIYVGLQIRTGNRETRAATIQSTLSSEMEMIAVLTENAAVWDKVVTGEPLSDGVETRKGILLFKLFMTDSENWYLQFKAGFLESQVWESRLGVLPELVSLPIFESWRPTLGARNHSADFLELLDNLADRASDV